ncbi:MAG: hypothetical protein IPK82_43035 [Polyangiaceae bacterium]|nr:hypothetical protein [Polyangiaceae bacterium]
MPAYVYIVHAEADFAARRAMEYALAYLVEPRAPGAEIDKDHFYVEPPLAIPTFNFDKASVFLILLSSHWLYEGEAQEQTQRALLRRREGTGQVVAIAVEPCHYEAVPLDDILILPTDNEGRLQWVGNEDSADGQWRDVAHGLESIFQDHARSREFSTRAAAHLAEPRRIVVQGPPPTRKPIFQNTADVSHIPNAGRGPVPTALGVPAQRVYTPPPIQVVVNKPVVVPQKPPPTGTELVLNRYKLVKELHRDLAGPVHEATDPHGRTFWVKLPSRDLGSDADAVRLRMVREADVLSSADSVHLPKIYDFGDDPRYGPVLILEPLRAATLLESIKREGRLSLAQMFPIFEGMLRGIKDAHSQRVWHRHLALNKFWLVLDHDGNLTVKLTDWGGCLRNGNDEDRRDSASAPSVFTHGPPEAAGRWTKLDATCDVYSAASCLFTALAGRPAFTGKNLLVVVEQKSQNDPPALSQITGESVSPALDMFLSRALARRPEHRFPSAESALSAWNMLR